MLNFLLGIRMEVYGATIAAIAAFAALYQGGLARRSAERQQRDARVQWTIAQLADLDHRLAVLMAAGASATADQRSGLEAALRSLQVALAVGAGDQGAFDQYVAALPHGTQSQLRTSLMLPTPTAAQASAPLQRLLSSFP